MERAIFNGEIIYATQIALDYDVEKTIRTASRKKLLLCPDETCKSRVVKYCHGDNKQPYFAHLESTSCDYEKFDKKHTYTKDIRYALYEHFKSNGYNVDIECKLIPHHRSHLVFNKATHPVAIEIGSKFTTTNDLDDINSNYQKNNVEFLWITVGELNEYELAETELGFIKRYAINESKENSCIVIDYLTMNVTQFKFRDNKLYKNECYAQHGRIEDLVFYENNIYLNGFKDNYSSWLEELIKDEQAQKATTYITPIVTKESLTSDETSVERETACGVTKDIPVLFKPIHNPFSKLSPKNSHSYWVIEYRNRHHMQKEFSKNIVCDRVFAFVNQQKNVCIYPCPLYKNYICTDILKCEACTFMSKSAGCMKRISDLQLVQKSVSFSSEKDSEGRLISATFPNQNSVQFSEIPKLGRSVPSLLKSFNVKSRAWFINIRDFVMSSEIDPNNINDLTAKHPILNEDIWLIYDWDF